MSKAIPFIVTVLLLLLEIGCATAPPHMMPQVIFLRGHYDSPLSHPSTEPIIALVRLTEVIPSEKYRSDPTYLGPQYVGDLPRVDVVRRAILFYLAEAGVSAEYRPEGILNGSTAATDGPLLLSVLIRRFEVTKTGPHELEAAVTLDCQLIELGGKTPMWQGSGEGTGWRVFEAIDKAVGGCVKPSSDLGQRRQNEAYAKLIKQIEAIGNSSAALDLYAQAYRMAPHPKQALTALGALGRLVRTSPKSVSLPEEARRSGVQAGALVQEKRYEEAIAKYDAALDLAPWWAEGHFNRALILADQNRYAEAIVSMRRFTTLAPESPDARAAQDKIYEWELKAK